jgi:hypothetical protein
VMGKKGLNENLIRSSRERITKNRFILANSREPSLNFLSNALAYNARDLEGKKPLFVKMSLFLIKDVPKMREIC